MTDSRERFIMKAEAIACWLTSECMVNTSSGNLHISFEEVNDLFHVDLPGDSELMYAIGKAFNRRLVAYVQYDEDFDILLYTGCCPRCDEYDEYSGNDLSESQVDHAIPAHINASSKYFDYDAMHGSSYKVGDTVYYITGPKSSKIETGKIVQINEYDTHLEFDVQSDDGSYIFTDTIDRFYPTRKAAEHDLPDKPKSKGDER